MNSNPLIYRLVEELCNVHKDGERTMFMLVDFIFHNFNVNQNHSQFNSTHNLCVEGGSAHNKGTQSNPPRSCYFKIMSPYMSRGIDFQNATLHTITIYVIDACVVLSLVLFLRDKEEKCIVMTSTITTTLTCPTTIQDVIGSSCDGCSFLSLALFCLY